MDLEGIAKTVENLRYHYMESKKAGVLALAAYLDALSSVCPNERWVFLGFSQGAHVLGDAVSSGDAGSLDEAQQAQLAAVVLIADPRFTPQEDFIAGTYEPVRQGLGHLWDAWLGVERGGIAGLRPVGDLSGAAGKIRSWCDAYDPTCQGVTGGKFDGSVHNGGRYLDAYLGDIMHFLTEKLAWTITSAGAGANR